MDNLNSLLNFQPINYSIEQIVLNIVLAFVLCLLVAWVYKLTHKGLSYSQSFIFTLIMDVLSPIGIIVLALLTVVFVHFISRILKVLFYVLLITFVVVVVFGVSYNDLLNWAYGVVLWVF